MKTTFDQLLCTASCIVLLFTACRTSQGSCGNNCCEIPPPPALSSTSIVTGGCDRAARALAIYDKMQVDKDDAARAAVARARKAGKHEDVLYPIQLNYAQEYINNFSRGSRLVRLFMGKNRRYSFLFDSVTLGAFASLYCQGKIDGVRAYISKYNANPKDPWCSRAKYYTIVLVGAKTGIGPDPGKYTDTLIQSSRAGVMIDLQDYSNPCGPKPCPEAILPTMPTSTTDPFTKR